MCNATVNNISVNSRRTALLVEETRVHREKHRPITDKLYHWISQELVLLVRQLFFIAQVVALLEGDYCI
jgi:hypothetical protein